MNKKFINLLQKPDFKKSKKLLIKKNIKKIRIYKNG